MPSKIITATLHDISPVPLGSIYRGDNMFEFSVDKDPANISKKFAEYDPAANTYYKDKAIKTKKLTADDAVKEAEKIKPVTKKDQV